MLQKAVQIFSCGTSSVKLSRTAARQPNRPSSEVSNKAPHAIRKGMEGVACPITGLSADGTQRESASTAAEALAELEADPDIVDERTVYMERSREPLAIVQPQVAPTTQFVALSVGDGGHKATRDTQYLVRSIGGLPVLRKFTTIFYEKSFVDSHIDKFLRDHSDPHGERFASWIAEKFGDGTPWTEERRTRPRTVMEVNGEQKLVAHDRSSAHYAAWHSPKREAHKFGQKFKPDDARVWMRLHFWAAREAGLFEAEHAAFMDYYIRFIGHFISVYSSKSPPFVRESARWSADPRNIERYYANGNYMSDVVDQPVEEALLQLPASERFYSGSRHQRTSWPYGGPHEVTYRG